MAVTMTLDSDQLEDFKIIRDLDPELLRAVVEHLQQLEPPSLRPDELFGGVLEVLDERKDAAESLVRESLVLYGWIRQRKCTVQQLLEGIRASLREDSDWTQPQLERWSNLEGVFGEFLSLPVIRLIANAIDLSFEYANVFLDARILTDIRPIFNNDATTIEGAVVSHTLRLHFGTMEGRRELNIAMDHWDVQDLAEQCDRAIQKAQTSRDLMQGTARIPTVISGGSDDV